MIYVECKQDRMQNAEVSYENKNPLLFMELINSMFMKLQT